MALGDDVSDEAHSASDTEEMIDIIGLDAEFESHARVHRDEDPSHDCSSSSSTDRIRASRG